MMRLIDDTGKRECFQCPATGTTHSQVREEHVREGKSVSDMLICRRCGSRARKVYADGKWTLAD